MKPYIKIMKDGPYLVFGGCEITQSHILADCEGVPTGYGEGGSFEIKPGKPAVLCRCGRSENAPFCDNAHSCAPRFDGAESAGFERFADGAEVFEGPLVILLDKEELCACARFCDAAGDIWTLVQTDDEDAAAQAVREANLCPSGRLVILDKAGNVLEDELAPEITLLEDSPLKVSGPICLRGGIRVIGESGEAYEVRTKQTLCRCGRSCNKPFCDGAHTKEPGWRADYPEN